MEMDFDTLKKIYLSNTKPTLIGQIRLIKEDYDCILHTIKYNLEEYYLIEYYRVINKHPELFNIIKDAMLKNNYTLTSRDFRPFKCDLDIIRMSIKNDPLSINETYIEEFPNDIYDYLINNISTIYDIKIQSILQNEYFISHMLEKNPNDIFNLNPAYIKDNYINIVLKSNKKLIINNPICSILKNNYQLLLKALESNSLYIKYFNLKSLTNEQIDELIDILLKDGYTISLSTPERLTYNKKLVKYSLIRNPNLISYIPIDEHPEIIETVIETHALKRLGYQKHNIGILRHPLILEDFLNDNDLDKETLDNIKTLFRYGLSINNTKEMLRSYYTKCWEEYKINNPQLYGHLIQNFKEILKHTQDIYEIKDSLSFFSYMIDLIKESTIEKAIRLYRQKLLKNEDTNEVLELINNLCSLYLNKSKDNFINQRLSKSIQHIKTINYTLDTSNRNVNNKIYRNKKLSKLRNSIKNNDPETINKINNILSKYNIDLDTKNELLNKILFGEDLDKPDNYDKYILREKILKFIKRLNLGNVNEKDIEYKNYQRYIIKNNGTYELYGLDIENINEIEKYKELEFIYKKLSVDISQLLNEINIDEDIEDIIRTLSITLDFNDDNFTFKFNIKLTINELIDRINKINLIIKDYPKEDKDLINKILYKDGLFLYSILSLEDIDDDKKTVINYEETIEIIKNYPRIIKVLGKEKFKVNNIENIIKINNIIKNSNIIDQYILGEEIIYKIITSNSLLYVDENGKPESLSTRIGKSSDLVSRMQTINEFTVPRINGQSTIYNYHIYDQNDTTALISGIDTNSCFKVSGVDNDFIHYCLLNKNGFIVKIEDKDGNFVGRISGFRNGNGIYFNELRSIYDYDKNIKTSLTHSTIRQGLLDVLKDIAKDIIDTCRKNGEQVDFATVIKYFVLSTVDNDYYGYDISQDLSKHFIHNGPMNTNTPDWQEFINTPNLIEKGHRFNGITEPGFLTDYQYGTTIMVVDSRIGTLTKDKIITYDPEPLYIRERYIKEDIINIDNINYFNKIKAINCNLNNTKFEPINLIGKHIIYGLNWYIIYDESIIETSINNKDSKSILEYRLTYNNLIEKQKIKRL